MGLMVAQVFARAYHRPRGVEVSGQGGKWVESHRAHGPAARQRDFPCGQMTCGVIVPKRASKSDHENRFVPPNVRPPLARLFHQSLLVGLLCSGVQLLSRVGYAEFLGAD